MKALEAELREAQERMERRLRLLETEALRRIAARLELLTPLQVHERIEEKHYRAFAFRLQTLEASYKTCIERQDAMLLELRKVGKRDGLLDHIPVSEG